jgi:hypothetical protein
MCLSVFCVLIDDNSTVPAQSNHILFAVVAEMAPRFDVMDLQLRRTSAVLASPPITLQDLPSE